MKDGTFREKLLQYPEIMNGTPLWTEEHELVRKYMDSVKPFRDSLVHASPFSQPERFGGKDKLQHIYSIDSRKALEATKLTVAVIDAIWKHIRGAKVSEPAWFESLKLSTLEVDF